MAGFDALPAVRDVFPAVRDAVAVVCQVESASLSAGTRFDDLGADSLSRVSIADVVESTLAADGHPIPRIDDAVLGRMADLGDLVDYLAVR